MDLKSLSKCAADMSDHISELISSVKNRRAAHSCVNGLNSRIRTIYKHSKTAHSAEKESAEHSIKR